MENTIPRSYLQTWCFKIAHALSLDYIASQISHIFDEIPEDCLVNYIGELNRNDVMH